MNKKMILDLDTGIDDALALVYALTYEEVEVIGITTSFGNVTLENATNNSINILDLLAFSSIEVYEGAEAPWGSQSYEPSTHLLRIHGDNGIGNVDLGQAKRKANAQSAVDFIIESAHRYGEDLIIYTAGPFTNLADALIKDRYAVEKIGNIVSMASAVTVPGNVTPYAEANINRDPKAAKFVLESGVPLTLVGLDVTLKTLIRESDILPWTLINNKASKAIAQLTEYYYINEFGDEDKGGAMHDPLAIEVALNPSIVKESFKSNLTVETEGVSAGRTIGDLRRLGSDDKSITVCLDVDSDLFIERFVARVDDLLRRL